MNSEELELSLRSEFETYLKGYFEKLTSDLEEFRSRMDAEFEKQKASFNEAVSGFAPTFDGNFEFDPAFRSSVSEHLRLARDEGAALTANAFAEAEKLQAESAPIVASYDKILAAVNDISSQTSQAAILKSLVAHATEFAPRGAFFITKSEQLVGWKVFPSEDESIERSIREVSLPISGNTMLGRSVRELQTVESAYGEYADDSLFLQKAGYGQPDRMYAIPLVARGRGVAVLYADYGDDGAALNREALETLVRVAALTVEVNAGGGGAAPAPRPDSKAADRPEPAQFATAPAIADTEQPRAAEYSYEQPQTPVSDQRSYAFENDRGSEPSFEPPVAEPAFEAPKFTAPVFEAPQQAESVEQTAPAFTQVEPSVEAAPEYEPVPVGAYDDAAIETTSGSFETGGSSTAYDNTSFDRGSVAGYEYDSGRVETPTFSEPASSGGFEFESYARADDRSSEGSIVYEKTPAEPTETFEADPVSDYASPFDEQVETVEVETVETEEYQNVEPEPAPTFASPAVETSYAAAEPAPVVETPAPRARLSDRPVDLPIEVSDDERRLHNDARRFARLLVSEIKLYNEKKVTEGREASDLYDRLREAIDRSREMYDKRVQPPVAAKFDYFHYELVNSLADGDDARLGSSYPGATV